MAQYDEAELMLDVLDRIGDHGFPNWASEAAALIRTQAARIAELEGHIARWSSIEGEVTRKAHARAEAAEAALAEMTRRRDEWRKKADGFDAVRLALREKVGTPWPANMSRLLWAGIAADEKKRADDAEADVARLREALGDIDAMDPEHMIQGYSQYAVKGLVLRMGEIARAALQPKEGK